MLSSSQNKAGSDRDFGGTGSQDGGAHGSENELSNSQTQQTQSKTRGRPKTASVSRNRVESPESEVGWKCDTCVQLFQSDKDKVLECEFCKNHRCLKCLGLPAATYKGLSGREDFPWFCNNCLPKTLHYLSEVKSIETRCSEFLASFEKTVTDKIQSVENTVQGYHQEIVEFKEEIKAEIQRVSGSVRAESDSDVKKKDTCSSNSVDTETVVAQAANKVQSRVDRKNNIVVFNVPESKKNLKTEVFQDDQLQIITLCDQIEIELKPEEILSQKRIGPKNQKRTVKGEEVLVPRPVLITLSEGMKPKVMKNVHKLRYTEEPYKSMSVKHDMTQDERKQEKELREEAKRMNDTSENFLFVVRGLPWERQIIKIKRRDPQIPENGIRDQAK